ncbi:hypothetical protein Q5752_000546 [Cryptotrichosporon argae]
MSNYQEEAERAQADAAARAAAAAQAAEDEANRQRVVQALKDSGYTYAESLVPRSQPH